MKSVMNYKFRKLENRKKTKLNNKNDKVPLISVCLIVKDEEQFLDKCLKSVKEISDEIIVIDTGSKDKTVEISKKYTDKIYFHTWKDSFSEARNHYFKYATGDWIFQIDADEELIKDDMPVLLKAVKRADIDAIRVQLISTYKKGEAESRHSAERIFRNNGIIHYEGRIHERLTGFKRPMIYPIRLLHYGYDLDDIKLTEKKHQRRVALLKQDIKEKPDNPLPYHYLGCCYLSKGQYRETLEVSLKAVELSEQQNDKNPVYLWSRYNAAIACYKLKDFKRAEELSKAAIKINDLHIDSYFILTLVSHDLKKWEDTISFGGNYLKLCNMFKQNPDKFGILVSSTVSMDWNILVLLGIAYFELGNNKNADEAFDMAIKKSIKQSPVSRAIGLYFFNKGELQKAKKYLEKALNLNPDDSIISDMLNKINSVKTSGHTISCCMIVKNEEKFLDKCLTSVKDYVDELIIVDTGSTDSTVDIAKKYTDKVYFHPWENSFSKARNQALSYATCDWVFQIDGDEELMEGSGERLKKSVREFKNNDVVFVKLLCSYANGAKTSMHYFERLFRNNGKIHYQGRVHNRIVGYNNPIYSQIELWHYGYDVDEDKAQEKFDRTTVLLKKDIEEDPNNPLPHHYISSSYLARGMFKEALKEAELAIQLADRSGNTNSIYGWTYFNASMSLFKLGDFNRAAKFSLSALEKYHDHLDSYYMLTVIAGEKSEWEAVCKYGENYIRVLRGLNDNPENSMMMVHNTISEAAAIYILIGHALHAGKNYNKMEEYYQKSYEAAKEKWQSSWNIGVFHLDKSLDMEIAGRFLKQAVEEAPNEYNVWYMLAKYYNKSGLKDNEIEALEKVIKLGTEEYFIFKRLFALYVDNELNDKAFPLMESIKTPDLSSYPYLLKLGNSFMSKGLLENAFKCYMKAAELNPDRHEAWSILSEITYTLGNFEDSQVFLEKALTHKKDDITNLLIMCELKLKSGDIESHVNYLDKVLNYLDIKTKRTINDFADLKNLFIEIGNSPNLIVTDYLKIKCIINELDSYINRIT